jgi:transposase
MRRLIWIGSDRTEKTFHEFFDWFGDSRCSKIKAVCPHMWKAYLKVIKDRIPNAMNACTRSVSYCSAPK